MRTTGLAWLTDRLPAAGLLAVAALGGLCFAPVFGLAALAGPVLAVCLISFAVLEAVRRWPVLSAWRPLLLPAGGVLAITETMLFSTTLAGLPTLATLQALGTGLRSWRRALESTWPARPDPELATFVPLLVLGACLLGVELLDRAGGLAALLPGLLVIGLAQAYEPATGAAAYLVALGFAAAAALVLAPRIGRAEDSGPPDASRARPRPVSGRRSTSGRRPPRDLRWLVAVSVLAVTASAGGLVLMGLDPAGRTPYTLEHAQAAEQPEPRIANPLDEVAQRLAEPGPVAFRYRAEEQVPRWRLVTLDRFDGANWTTNRPFLRLGAELEPGDAVSVPTTRHSAEVDLRALGPPWLPSRPLPYSVDGAEGVLVEPDGGTLIAPGPPDRYTLTWSTPQVTAEDLLGAAVDGDVPVGDLGRVPGRIADLAAEAAGGRRATFRTALALERYLSSRYELATAGERPSGSGWPQLSRFLFEDRRGTSEQFAAAYVVLARLNGIPARLVVGFRAPAVADLDGWTSVHNRDVLVWPEVAVEGIGWWPLDPAGLADPGRAPAGDDVVTEQARAELPPNEQLTDPAVPPEDRAEADAGVDADENDGTGPAWWRWLLLLLLPPACWPVVAPAARRLRARARRRRTGADAVAGAWAEARDRLRAHGVAVDPGMTVRDLAVAAAPILGTSSPEPVGLERLARAVDEALWSSGAVGEHVVREAWTGVAELISQLRARPRPARLWAALHLPSLLSPPTVK